MMIRIMIHHQLLPNAQKPEELQDITEPPEKISERFPLIPCYSEPVIWCIGREKITTSLRRRRVKFLKEGKQGYAIRLPQTLQIPVYKFDWETAPESTNFCISSFWEAWSTPKSP